MFSLRSRCPLPRSPYWRWLIWPLLLATGLAALAGCRRAAPVAESGAPSTPLSNSPTNSPPAPPPPPGAAFIGLLTPEQTTQIKTLGVPLVLPTNIPPGFAVDRVDLNQSDRFTGYQVLYRDSSDQCFAIEYTTGDVGSIPETENRMVINLPWSATTAGYSLNYGHYVDPALRDQFPEPELISDWLPMGEGLYRLTGAAYINKVVAPARPCQDVPVEIAVSILESSTVITDEIQGDGIVPQ